MNPVVIGVACWFGLPFLLVLIAWIASLLGERFDRAMDRAFGVDDPFERWARLPTVTPPHERRRA